MPATLPCEFLTLLEALMYYLAEGLFWVFLAFNGLFVLGAAGYWIGKAIINQAHADIRPDDDDLRRRLYKAVQLGTTVGITWVIGWLVGIDWSEFLRSNDNY